MSTPSRNASPQNVTAASRTFFVSTNAVEKRNILQSERMAMLLIQTMLRYRDQGKFRLHEFVVMPNHCHLLLTIGQTLSIEKAVQFVKGGFSFRAGKEFGFKGEIWQSGFSDERVTDSEHYANCQNYIWMNPVKDGLAISPEQFPFSSAVGNFPVDGPPIFGRG